MKQLDYELGKELKDVGFPQNGKGERQYFRSGVRDRTEYGHEGEAVYFPTLSELIEACGDEFMSLRRAESYEYKGKGWYPNGMWIAYRKNYPKYDEPEFDENGEHVGTKTHGIQKEHSSEEAVARLWLAVYSKDAKTRSGLPGEIQPLA